VDTSRENPRHPVNDPAFLARRPPNPDNPANDPDFLFRLIERMESDPTTREAVWQSFYDGSLSFLFHDAQLEAFEIIKDQDVKEFLIFCARQWGKSFFILVVAVMHCSKPYGLRMPLVRIFCQTVKQVEDIVNDNMQLLLMLAPPGWIKRTKSDNRWKVGVGEIRLCPIAAAHVDGKRGGNATLVLIEEGCVTKSDQYKKALGSVINPQLIRSRGRLGHITTPPEDTSHYVNTEVLPKCIRSGAYARKTVYDNPQLIDEQIIEAFERCTDIEEWDREFLVKIVRSQVSTAVPEFEEEMVRTFDLPACAKYWIAGDWGGVRDKTVFLVMTYDFMRAKVLVVDEACFDKHTRTQVVVDTVKAMEKRWNLPAKLARWVDCPGQLQVDLMGTHKFTVALPQKDGFEPSVNLVRVAMATTEIHSRCQFLAKTLREARINPARTDFERTDALGHADALMALCYGIRHANKTNPFPPHGGKDPHTHYIPKDAVRLSQSAEVFRSLFKVR
jgi:hypothetical protein